MPQPNEDLEIASSDATLNPPNPPASKARDWLFLLGGLR